MPQEDSKRLVDSVIHLWNTGDPAIAKKLYSETAQRTDPNQAEPARGSEQIARYVAEVRTGFPDFKLVVNDSVAEGSRLVTHWTCTGTHQREFQGIPATGKFITVNGIALARIEQGKIVEELVYFDRLAMLQQLGAAAEIGQPQAKRAAH